MSDPDPAPDPPEKARDVSDDEPGPSGASKPPVADQSGGAAEESDGEELSAEEQMARYEESLKNDDWGHQPC